MTLDNINIDERELVEQLRIRMKGEMSEEMFEDDSVFQRFLRARNHDLDAAEAMLRNNINWRNRNKVDTILTEYKPLEVLTKYMTLNRLGFDKEGCPVFYSHIGHLDHKGIIKSSLKSDISLHVVRFLEENLRDMKIKSKELGKPIEKWSYIVNYENFSISVATHKPTLEIFANLLTVYDQNYPERLKNAYLINAPFAFTLCWPLLKPLLSGNTVKKMYIYGKEGWQDEITKNIDPATIPGFLGGRLTDPDGNPMCQTIIVKGGTIPEIYHTVSKASNATRIKHSTKLVVARMSKAEVRVEVKQPRSRIEWELDVAQRDISFSLLFEGNGFTDSGIREVVPKQRVASDLTCESGTYLCEETGTYILEFDNTYSWMHNKEIYYNVSVVDALDIALS